MRLLDKELLQNLYCFQYLSKEKICGICHVTMETLNYNLFTYKLTRDKKEVISQKQKERFDKDYRSRVAHIDVEELKIFYIEENHTYQEVLDKYDITGNTLDRFLKENNIHKSKRQASLLGVQTAYKRADGKESYDAKVRAKMNDTFIANYGSYEAYKKHLSNACKAAWTKDLKSRQSDWIKTKYHNHPDKLEHAKEIRRRTNIERYGVPNTYLLADFTCNSKTNIEFGNLLSDMGVDYEPEYKIVDNDGHLYRFDFKCGNTLVELNPWPFHNTTFTPNGAPVIDKEYHRKKTEVGNSQGFRVLNIWDWDNKEKVLKLLENRSRCYARQCIVKEIDRNTAAKFINTHHLQGYTNDKIRIALCYKDNIVSVMTFGKPRYNKNYEYELVRYCSCYNVIGGANKLFSYFLKHYSPSSIVSYCDRSKFRGDIYKELGFSEVGTGVSKHWYNINTQKHILDSSLRMKGFDILLGEEYGCYGKGTSNEELMRAHGFVEIYDAGQTTYSFIKGDN